MSLPPRVSGELPSPSPSTSFRCRGGDCHRYLLSRFETLREFSRFAEESNNFLFLDKDREEDFNARPRFLPRWEELEEDADYKGGRGHGGLPEGEGRLWFPEDGAAFGGRGRREEEEEDAGLALRSVEGNFRKGLLEGPAVLKYEVSLTRLMKAHANGISSNNYRSEYVGMLSPHTTFTFTLQEETKTNKTRRFCLRFNSRGI